MSNFDKVNKYYHTIINGKRLWDITKVAKAVEHHLITEAEFELITGIPYDEYINQ